MTFLEEADFRPYIKDTNLARMIEGDTTIVDTAEDTAIAVVNDYLFKLYDTEVDLGKVGAARPPQLVRWITVVTLYYLYERLPSGIMPQRVGDNYKEVMATLRDISDGKQPTNLTRIVLADGEEKTKFRYGAALPPRNHQL